MNIEDKLKLSLKSDRIYFFKEGVFAQLFGISLYLAVEHLGLGVKIGSYRYKKLGNNLVLRAGLPLTSLEKRCSGLVKRDFGYELLNQWEFDINAYKQWHQQQCNLQLMLTEQSTIQTPSNLIESQHLFQINDKQAEYLNEKTLTLSSQELLFLLSWQKDKYSANTESNFISRLAQKIKSNT